MKEGKDKVLPHFPLFAKGKDRHEPPESLESVSYVSGISCSPR